MYLQPSLGPVVSNIVSSATQTSDYAYVLYYSPKCDNCKLLLSQFGNVPKVRYQNYDELTPSIKQNKSLAWLTGVPTMINIHDYTIWYGSQVFDELQSCMRHLVHFGNVVPKPWSEQKIPKQTTAFPTASINNPNTAAASSTSSTSHTSSISRFAHVSDPAMRQQLEEEQKRRDDMIRSATGNSGSTHNSSGRQNSETKKSADTIRELPSKIDVQQQQPFGQAPVLPQIPTFAPQVVPMQNQQIQPQQQQQQPSHPQLSQPSLQPSQPQLSTIVNQQAPSFTQPTSQLPMQNIGTSFSLPVHQTGNMPFVQHSSKENSTPQNLDLTKRLDKFEQLLYDLALRLPITISQPNYNTTRPTVASVTPRPTQLSPLLPVMPKVPSTTPFPTHSSLPIISSSLPMISTKPEPLELPVALRLKDLPVGDNDILKRFEPASPVVTRTEEQDDNNSVQTFETYESVARSVLEPVQDKVPVVQDSVDSSKSHPVVHHLKDVLQNPEQRALAVNMFSSIANVNDAVDAMSIKSVPSEIFDSVPKPPELPPPQKTRKKSTAQKRTIVKVSDPILLTVAPSSKPSKSQRPGSPTRQQPSGLGQTKTSRDKNNVKCATGQ